MKFLATFPRRCNLRPFHPRFGMSGLASRLLDAALEDGDMRGPLSGMFPVHLPVPSFADALAPLSDKLPKIEPSKGQLAKMAWK